MAIRVENITKIYGEQRAVDSLSFEVPKGNIVGFLGPNGAGKSTTMKILTGFIPPTSGKAFIAGMNVEEKPLQTRLKTGYLPEHNPLYLDMYVREYLQFIAELNGVRTPKKRVEEMIELTGLTLERKKKMGTLSKGFRQRVGIAQALIHNPDVLILDEPTSGFDPNQTAEIRKLIKTLGTEKTVLLSTHIMQEVEALCERVIIINRGKIIADNPTHEIGKTWNPVHTIYVEFSAQIPQNSLQHPLFISCKPESKSHSWRITTNDPNNAKIELNKIAAQHQAYILEQKEEQETLEEIFQRLTQNVDTI